MNKWTALFLLVCGGVVAGAQQGPVFEMDFTNAKLVPAHWVLKLNPDGSGQFDAEGGDPQPQDKGQIAAGDVHRAVQLSPAFTAKVFALARAKKLFAIKCDSHMKVAFQGMKRLSYMGPEGSGSCEYNYSKDSQIQALGDSLIAVEATLISAARLEKLLQHDRLGLDRELEFLSAAALNGNAQEVGAIHETLARIADDDQVMERARKKARLLMVKGGVGSRE